MGKLTAADQSENSDKTIQKVPGFIDPDRRNSVQGRRDHIEDSTVIVKVAPVKSAPVVKQR